MTRRTPPTNDRGQVSAWLVRLLLLLAVLGFLLIEFGAVVINRVQAGDVAGQAAAEAGIAFANSNRVEAAEARAEEFAELNDAEFVDLRIERREGLIYVTVRKTAATRVIHRIGVIEDLAEAEVTESAPLRQ